MDMDPLIAIGHIAGSILVVLAIEFITFLIASQVADRYNKQALDDAPINLGVSIDDLDNEELTPKLLQRSSERFSSELLRNRISDFFGVMQTLWNWLGLLTLAVVLLGVVWYTITESLDTAVYAWTIVAIELFFCITSFVFTLMCWLLTGRYPGQSKHVRKSMVEFLRLSAYERNSRHRA